MSYTVEAEFPDLITGDAVGQEVQALVQRYRLLARLHDHRGARRDLRGDAVDVSLACEMQRQLVSGVDLPFLGAEAGWPIRPGVRLERLAFSPWLADVALPGLLPLPDSAEAFVAAFGQATGIDSAYAERMDYAYRITPRQLGRVAMQVRGEAEQPSAAFLLLASRHFDEAAEASELLRGPSRLAPRFRRPAIIDGFRLLAELEREALVVADLARLNRLSVVEIRSLLAVSLGNPVGGATANPRPLAEALATSPELRRLLSYVMVGTDVLGGLHNAAADGYVPAHASAWTTILAHGDLGTTPGDIERILIENGELMRVAATAAFPCSAPGSRQSVLSNDEPATFWGINNHILPFVAQDDITKAGFKGGRGGATVGGASIPLEDRASIAQLILAHGDPFVSGVVRSASRGQAVAKAQDDAGAHRQKMGGGYAKFVLPLHGAPGSAARFDPTLWGAERYRDAPFWAMFQGDLSLLATLRISEAERAEVVAALADAREMFAYGFALGVPTSNTARVLCDLATGVSSLTTNRAMAPALEQVLTALAGLCPHTGGQVTRYSHRWMSGAAAFLIERKRSGVPPPASGTRNSARQLRRIAKKKRAGRPRPAGS